MKNNSIYRPLAWFLMLTLSLGSITQATAAALSLATTPLAATTSGTAVRPNLMYVLDDSGSMAWDYTPDYINDNGITDPTNVLYGPPGSSGDRGTITVDGSGRILTITATGGNIYEHATPTVLIQSSDTPPGTGAAATVTLAANKTISSVNVTSGGSGYSAAKTYVTFLGGLKTAGWGMCWGTTSSGSTSGPPKDTPSSPACSLTTQPPYSAAPINYQYYDPAVRYLPPLKADGTSYDPASTSSPVSDGFAGGAGTANRFTTGWPHEVWCTTSTAAPTAGDPTAGGKCRENLDTSNNTLYPNAIYTFRRPYSGVASYYTMDPSEYCTSTDYTSCISRAAALAAVPPYRIGSVDYTVPSKYRWCAYYNPISKSFGGCQGRRDLDHYIPNYLGGWTSSATTGVQATASLVVSPTNGAQNLTGVSIGGVDVVGGTSFTSTVAGDQATVAQSICTAIQANSATSGYTCARTGSTVLIQAVEPGIVPNGKQILASGNVASGTYSKGTMSVSPSGAAPGLSINTISIAGTELLNSVVTASGVSPGNENATAKAICEAIVAHSGTSGYTARSDTGARIAADLTAWGSCVLPDDSTLGIKRMAADATVNGVQINYDGPATATTNVGAIQVNSSSGATNITDVTLAGVSILSPKPLSIADGTATIAIADSLAAGLSGHGGCTATATGDVTVVTITGCTGALVVTSPGGLPTGVIKVTSTGHAGFGARIGGIKAGTQSILGDTSFASGTAASTNANAIVAGINAGTLTGLTHGFTAAAPVLSGSDYTITVTAPSLSYNGLSFEFMDGAASGAVAGTAPQWTFVLNQADDDGARIDNIQCNGVDTFLGDAYTGTTSYRTNLINDIASHVNTANGFDSAKSYCTTSGVNSDEVKCVFYKAGTTSCTPTRTRSGGNLDLKDLSNGNSGIYSGYRYYQFTIDEISTNDEGLSAITCAGLNMLSATVTTGKRTATRINNLTAHLMANPANDYSYSCTAATASSAQSTCTVTGPVGAAACTTLTYDLDSGASNDSYSDIDDIGANTRTNAGGGATAGVDNFAPYLISPNSPSFSGGVATQGTTVTAITSTTVGKITANASTMSAGVVAADIIPTNASGGTLTMGTDTLGVAPDPTANHWTGVGLFKRVDIKSGTTYNRASGRTDCADGVSCSAAEELQNFANWYSYYRTRMLLMKSATTLAFNQLDDKYRVGFDSICGVASSGSQHASCGGAWTAGQQLTAPVCPVAEFSGTARSNWWTSLTSIGTSCATPLRAETAKIGRYYAGKLSTDPATHSCQQNYMLLVTDGYWNESEPSNTNIAGTGDINNTDNAASRPYYDGAVGTSSNAATCAATPAVGTSRGASAYSCRTLADIAYYYYSTDLRTTALGNATNAAGDVGTNNVLTTSDDKNQAQHMNFFAMGLGIDGKLDFNSDYQTSGVGDYAAIVAGTKQWPAVANLDPTGVDDLWHATVNGRGKYFSARNVPNVIAGLREALNKIGARVGSAAAAATSNLEPVAGDNYAYVASYATVDWTGDLQSRSINVATGDVSSDTNCGSTGIATTITGSNGATSITVGSATDLVVGSAVSGTGIATGAVVTAISGTTLTLSLPNTTDVSGTGTFKYGCQWSAQSKLDATTWSSRRIFVRPSSGTSGDSLRLFTYSGLSAAEKAYFSPTTLSQYSSLSSSVDITAENLVNFLRGQRSFEQDGDNSHDQIWRRRTHVFGDIVNTQPVFMKRPSAAYTDAGYADFKTTGTAANRKPVVFVSAQDGMLHAINAHVAAVSVSGATVQPGGEMWAFIPTQILPSMKVLADVNYAHRYFVDGQITIADVDFGSGDWHTILIGGQGAGGTSYYALDITDPENPTYLWEFSTANLGYTFSNSTVSKLYSGEWAVLFTSGYNNTGGDGQGHLFALNPATGAVKTGFPLSTNSGNSGSPSNLGKLAVWADSPSTNNTAQYAYAGDLNGDLWRFDLDHTGTGHTGTQVFKLAHLENGGVVQPITTKPELSQLESGTRLVFVGTGKYVETADLSNIDVQGFYAIKDTLGAANFGGASQATWNPATDTTTIDVLGVPTVVPKFLARRLLSVNQDGVAITEESNGVTRNARKICPGASSQIARVVAPLATKTGACIDTDPTAMDWDIYGGWYVSLPENGERVNVDPKLVRGTLVFASNIPESSACTVGGRSWANFLDYSTGLGVTGQETVSIKISDSLVVGITVVKLQSGHYKAIATKSNYQQETLSVPVSASASSGGSGSSSVFGGKRGLWREFEAY